MDKLYNKKNLDIEKYIEKISKRIIYLLCPNIEIYTQVKNNFKGCQKFQKLAIIISEVVSKIGRTCVYCEDRCRAEELNKNLIIEIRDQEMMIQKVQKQSRRLEEKNKQYVKNIVQLTKAFEESKKYYEEEIKDYKSENQEMKMLLKDRKEEINNKSFYDLQLNTPSEKKLSIERYSDKSIYRRFSNEIPPLKNHYYEEQIKIADPFSEKLKESMLNLEKEIQLMKQSQQQKELLKKKIDSLEKEKLEAQKVEKQLKGNIKILKEKLIEQSNKLRQYNSKINEKNKMINDLLDKINNGM